MPIGAEAGDAAHRPIAELHERVAFTAVLACDEVSRGAGLRTPTSAELGYVAHEGFPISMRLPLKDTPASLRCHGSHATIRMPIRVYHAS